MARFLLQVALVILVVLFALRKGGKPERQIALILFGMLAANTLYGLIVGWWSDYDQIPWYRVVLDCIGFGLILTVALRADRWWPLWVSGVQLLSVLAHLLRALDADLHPLVYAVMERWPYWMAIGLTGLGTYLHASRAETASNG